MTAKTIKRSLLAMLLAFALEGGSATNAATVVYNNIPASPAYYQLGGNWFGTLGNQYQITATTFTPSASGQLDELTLGVTYSSGINSVTLRLSPDTGGLPGTPIWQTSVAPPTMWGSLLNITGIAGPAISSSQMYWLEAVAPVDPLTFHSWWSNNQGDVGPVLATGTYVASTDRFSLRVGIVSPNFPEPATCILLVSGSLGLAFTRRRR